MSKYGTGAAKFSDGTTRLVKNFGKKKSKPKKIRQKRKKR